VPLSSKAILCCIACSPLAGLVRRHLPVQGHRGRSCWREAAAEVANEGLHTRPLPPWGSTSRTLARGSVLSNATSVGPVVAAACATLPPSRPPSPPPSEAACSRRWRCERGLGVEPSGRPLEWEKSMCGAHHRVTRLRRAPLTVLIDSFANASPLRVYN
jgi:hypothetical protein